MRSGVPVSVVVSSEPTRPVTLEMHVPAQAVSPGSATFLAFWDGEEHRWVPVASSVSVRDREVSAQVAHLSVWSWFSAPIGQIRDALTSGFRSVAEQVPSNLSHPTCSQPPVDASLSVGVSSPANPAIEACLDTTAGQTVVRLVNRRAWPIAFLAPKSGGVVLESINGLDPPDRIIDAAYRVATPRFLLIPSGTEATLDIGQEAKIPIALQADPDPGPFLVAALLDGIDELAGVSGASGFDISTPEGLAHVESTARGLVDCMTSPGSSATAILHQCLGSIGTLFELAGVGFVSDVLGLIDLAALLPAAVGGALASLTGDGSSTLAITSVPQESCLSNAQASAVVHEQATGPGYRTFDAAGIQCKDGWAIGTLLADGQSFGLVSFRFTNATWTYFYGAASANSFCDELWQGGAPESLASVCEYPNAAELPRTPTEAAQVTAEVLNNQMRTDPASRRVTMDGLVVFPSDFAEQFGVTVWTYHWVVGGCKPSASEASAVCTITGSLGNRPTVGATLDALRHATVGGWWSIEDASIDLGNE